MESKFANKLFWGAFFSAESIFAVCQAVSLAVWLLAAKIQDGFLKIKCIIITRVASSDYHYDDRKTLLKPTTMPTTTTTTTTTTTIQPLSIN